MTRAAQPPTSARDKVAIDRERLALYRAAGRRSPLARGFARLHPAKLLILGAPLAAGLAIVGADQVIGLTGWLLGAQMFDLFSERELARFSWLTAIVIAAVTVAAFGYLRRRYQVLFRIRDELGDKPGSEAINRAAPRLAEELAPDRHRLQVQVLAIAALAALLFSGLALSLRALPPRGEWPPDWRAEIVSPRALLFDGAGGKIDRVPLAASCEAGQGAPIPASACQAPGCRARALLALKAGEKLALFASRAGSAQLFLHGREVAIERGGHGAFGRSVGTGALSPAQPLALTAPRAGWYALDLDFPAGSPPSICVALPTRGQGAVAPRAPRH